MRTSIATVSISGSLVEKLHACAAAGFDGVEIFEPDLIASDHSPEEIRGLARRLGLSLDLYQPLRDIEGVDEATFAENLRRAAATFATAQRLGIDTVLVCSNVATATVDSDEHSADQLRRLGDVARVTTSGWPSRRWPGAASSTTTGGPGASSNWPTIPPWRVPRQLPRAVPRPRPGRHRGHPRREDLLPPARRRPALTWTCCRGAVTTGSSPARATSTWPPSSPTCCRRASTAPVAGGLQRHLPSDRSRPHRGARPAVTGLAAGQGRRVATAGGPRS